MPYSFDRSGGPSALLLPAPRGCAVPGRGEETLQHADSAPTGTTEGPPSSARPALALVAASCAVCGARDAAPEAIGPDFEHDTVPGEFCFVRCRACGHLYLDPRPALDDLAAIYPANYYAYSDVGHPLARWLRRLREARKVRIFRDAIGDGPRRILDLGCGNGRLLSMLRDHGSTDWKLEGIDFSAEAVRHCLALGFRAQATRIQDFDAEDDSFDAVIMIQLIEHLEDPRGAFERVRALLRPGGVFILETPNVGGLDYRWFRGRWWGMYHFPRHWNLFSSGALKRMLEDAGFTVLRRDSLISTSSWILSLHNLLLDRGWPQWLVRLFHFQNPVLLPPFASIDLVLMGLGFDTSDQRVIARKSG